MPTHLPSLANVVETPFPSRGRAGDGVSVKNFYYFQPAKQLRSINQIKQSFGSVELYPSIEEKAANLLYLITKNHSFVDGNKRIAAACFLYFLQQNNALLNSNGEPIISNETLATLTLYIANSRTEESEVLKQLIISVLNRNK